MRSLILSDCDLFWVNFNARSRQLAVNSSFTCGVQSLERYTLLVFAVKYLRASDLDCAQRENRVHTTCRQSRQTTTWFGILVASKLEIVLSVFFVSV